MGKARLEAFSDGVIAILITIMVLELRVPDGASVQALGPVLPILASYALSFIYLGIYWVNHHHLFHAVHKVTGPILWANLHLLFWLSLVPFTTRWVGEYPHSSVPTAVYGVSFLMPGLAWLILQTAILQAQGPESKLARAIGSDFKGKASAALYAAAVPVAFIRPWLSDVIYVAVALVWLVPDRRIELVTNPQDAATRTPRSGE